LGASRGLLCDSYAVLSDWPLLPETPPLTWQSLGGKRRDLIATHYLIGPYATITQYRPITSY